MTAMDNSRIISPDGAQPHGLSETNIDRKSRMPRGNDYERWEWALSLEDEAAHGTKPTVIHHREMDMPPA
jgi:hypothetical protein